MTCQHCRSEFTPNRSTQKFCSKRCKGIFNVLLNRYRVRLRLIQLHGGKCILCGYAHPAGLTFHHRNPDEKLFQLDASVCKAYPTMLAEAAKCDLICANCHAEKHGDWWAREELNLHLSA